MSLSRRHFLAAVAGAMGANGWSLTGCSLLPAKADSLKSREYVGASKLSDGRFAVQSLNNDSTPRWQTPVEARCHGGCFRPHNAQVLIFERRPGWWFHVFDSRNGERLAHIKANDGEHFYGHGVFSPDGRYLYTTASRYQRGDGIIAVYDAHAGYERVDTLDLEGIGPHELHLHPDGQTLVVALGGIKTHPDYDRIKMNLESMAPALMLVDRTTGQGKLIRMGTGAPAQELATLPLHWDNHLV